METWGIWYIVRVSLFGLSPRGINLMNLSNEPVQLNFSLLYISLLDAFFLFLHAYARDTVFNTFSFDSDLSIHVSLSLYATWHSPDHSLWSFDSPGSLCPDLAGWSLWILPVTDHSGAAVAWISGRPFEVLSSQTPCSALEFFCYDSEPPFVLFTLVPSFVFSQLRHISAVSYTHLTLPTKRIV